MLAIRLHRQGKKNQPFFKIVVTEKQKSSTRGRFVEEVGFYNPLTKERKIVGERVKYWMSVGAQPSDTVHNMLVSEKIIDSPKIPKHKKTKKKEEETAADSTTTAEATPEKKADKEEKPKEAEQQTETLESKEKEEKEETKQEAPETEEKK